MEDLKTTVAEILSLAEQEWSKSTESGILPKSDDSVNVLSLTRDAAALLKAHSTKISLLVINAPFTPSAICKCLREIMAGPLPALALATENCDPKLVSHVMADELAWQIRQVRNAFVLLVEEIPLDGQTLSAEAQNGTSAGGSRGSLASTGVLWQSCDDLARLKDIGIASLMIRKAEQYRATLKDALEELQDWGNAHSDDEEKSAMRSSDDGHDRYVVDHAEDEEDAIYSESDATPATTISAASTPDPAQAAIDAMFASDQGIPQGDPLGIRPRLDSCVRRLKLVTMLYTAIIKRRLNVPFLAEIPLPVLNKEGEYIGTLNHALKELARITELVDDLASSFYDCDAEEIDSAAERVWHAAQTTALSLTMNWMGKDDEYSAWALKFADMLGRKHDRDICLCKDTRES